ncbi:MAG TPA: DUF5753 domain-containing protein, partial [Pseudonocardiaceae bacterium]|nr:DUF5753 domain-containing protein [Pseudonocardiaceae bacterium]
GLVQTMDYSRASMTQHAIADADIEVRLTARLRRQQTLQRTDLSYSALIGEPALRTIVGDPSIQAAQLRALLAAAKRRNVSVRVVPAAGQGHPGQLGAFMTLWFPSEHPIVHVEMATSGAFLDKDPQVQPYLDALPRIEAVALSGTESLRLIANIVREMEAST